MPVMLEIAFTHTVKLIPFDSIEDANKIVEELSPLIGRDMYSRNDKDKGSYVIKSPVGNTVVHVAAICALSATDYTKYTDSQAVIDFNKHEFNLSERYIKQMVEAGLERYINIK